jgi:catechol 2,3-dioxygenase-like lactoylglutathione lyase family enzyme
MTRREMAALLAAASLPRVRAQAPLQFRGLDHIEFTVADVEKSVAFYAQLFGGTDVMKNRTTTRRYIRLGSSYMAIDRADATRIDHACAAIENFDIAAVHAHITAQGLTYRDYPSGRDTGVNDPDGTRLQLSSANGWTSLAAQTASPEPRELRQPPLFQPLLLAAVQVGVTDSQRAKSHYDRLLGNAPYLTLKEAATAGYSRFTIRVAPFDLRIADARLAALGARIETAERPNTVQFLDPDGFRVEITTA